MVNINDLFSQRQIKIIIDFFIKTEIILKNKNMLRSYQCCMYNEFINFISINMIQIVTNDE